jgi:hypothetical protein
MRAFGPAIALALFGCASTNLTVVPSGSDLRPEARPANCHIEFFRTKPPDRPYDEIAAFHLTGNQFITPAAAQERLRLEACRLGAHALVVTRDYFLSTMTATAIVYRGAVAKDAGQPDPPPAPPPAPEPEPWMKKTCSRDVDSVAARVRVATSLRDGPDAAAPFLTFVDADATVCAAARPSGSFRKVVLSDGRTGYVTDSVLELGKPTVAPAPSPAPPRPPPADKPAREKPAPRPI